MKAFGCGIKSRKESPTELSEVSLSVSVRELETLIEFLNFVKKRHSSYSAIPGLYHTHLKDWENKPSLKPDVIILTEFNGE